MGALWNAVEAVGLAPLARKGYLALRAGPHGWRHRSRVAGVEATFATTSMLEYRRVTTLHGERRVLRSLLASLDGEETVWDVGANVGIYACFLARALSSGRVVAFEPEPTNRARLRENLRANAPADRWQTSAVALSDRNGSGRLTSAHPDARRTEVGAGHHYLSADGRLDVDCRRGETLVERGVPAPDVLKVDVQGAELQVLEGMGDALNDVAAVFAELHVEKSARYGDTAAAVEQFLRDAGYDVTDLGAPDGDRRGVYFVRATR